MTQTELIAKIREYKQLKQMSSEIADQLQLIEDSLKEELALRKTDEMMVDVYTVKHSAYDTSRFDSTRFKSEHPDIYSLYSKTVKAYRFTVT